VKNTDEIPEGAVSVGQLTMAIRGLLEEGIGDVLVVGEVSNYKQHTSGHRYFTLKDGDAAIAGVMWRSRTLTFLPEDGMQVVVGGKLSVYAARGTYQIDCAYMRPLGVGGLWAAFEKLKTELALRGWFSHERKRPLPRFPKTVGVITSPTGAAVQDILSTLQRRFPALNVIVRPTLVQGDGSAEDIVAAIEAMNTTDADVIIVGRGGGSIEDLWSFNTEIVAEAILNSRIPIVSAVGHETDTTIADFVADKRAATPTAAAELVTPITAQDLAFALDDLHERIVQTMQENVSALRDMADAFVDGTAARRIIERLHHRGQRIDELHSRTIRTIDHRIVVLKQQLEHHRTHLTSLHPERPLKLGYAIVERDGRPLSVNDPLHPQDRLTLKRAADTSTVVVESLSPRT
jgi:exodeoxyribonuclease VII large subunit